MKGLPALLFYIIYCACVNGIDLSTQEKPIKHHLCPVDEDPANPTHLPYQGNCEKFYKCSHGYAYPMDCPAGLHWSIQLDRCEWPDTANCDPKATTPNVPITKPTSKPTKPTKEPEKPIKHHLCPANIDPANPTHLPYQGNCEKFYKCSNGYAYPMDCPTGLHWSIQLDRCEWPDTANCDPKATTPNVPITKPTSKPTKPTKEPEKPIKHHLCLANEDPANPTHLPYQGNCGKFYKCSHGYAYPMDCPAGLHWSIQLDRCEWPDTANCDPKATTSSMITCEKAIETQNDYINPEKHPNCPLEEDPTNPTHLPYPGNCEKFYVCYDGYAYPMNCECNSHWSITLNSCVDPDIAKCDNETAKTTVTSSTTKISDKPFKHPRCPAYDDPKHPINLPYPGDCGKFFKCSAGYAYAMDCPAGLHWGVELDRCDYPENANCDPKATTPLEPITNPTEIVPTTDEAITSTQTITTAITSTESVTTDQPENTTFETTANSYFTTTPESISTGITKEIEKPIKHHLCPVDEDPGNPTHLPYQGNCGKFYKCSKGYAYPMDCPASLHWSIELNRCEWPDIANCDPLATTPNVPISKPTINPTSTSTGPTKDPEKPIKHPRCPVDEDPQNPTLLPYQGNCSKFYKCQTGYAYPMNCPASLHWSIKLNRCDDPTLAECDPTATTSMEIITKPTTERTSTTEEDEKPFSHPGCPIDENPINPTHLPYQGNCGKYYKCNAGYAYPMACVPGLHWSIELNRCDYPEIAKCNPSATTKSIYPTKHPDEDIPFRHPACPMFPDVYEEIYLAYPGYCRKFLKCVYGYAVPCNCPLGTHWSIKYHRCEWPDIAKCEE